MAPEKCHYCSPRLHNWKELPNFPLFSLLGVRRWNVFPFVFCPWRTPSLSEVTKKKTERLSEWMRERTSMTLKKTKKLKNTTITESKWLLQQKRHKEKKTPTENKKNPSTTKQFFLSFLHGSLFVKLQFEFSFFPSAHSSQTCRQFWARERKENKTFMKTNQIHKQTASW